MIRDAGHEMYGSYTTWRKIMTLNQYVRRGLHGYSHENPVKMSIEQQHAILDKTYKDLTKFCGKPPRGNVCSLGFHIFSWTTFWISRHVLRVFDQFQSSKKPLKQVSLNCEM